MTGRAGGLLREAGSARPHRAPLGRAMPQISTVGAVVGVELAWLETTATSK